MSFDILVHRSGHFLDRFKYPLGIVKLTSYEDLKREHLGIHVTNQSILRKKLVL